MAKATKNAETIQPITQVQIMPLVIYALGNEHTDRQTDTDIDTHTHV